MEAAADKSFLDTERSQARWAGIAAGLAAVFFFAAIPISGGALTDVRRSSNADLLTAYNADPSSALTMPAVLQALSFLLMGLPLLYLYRAAAHRNPAVRRQFLGFFFLGPILVAAQFLLFSVGMKDVSEKFVDQNPAAAVSHDSNDDVDEDAPEEELADDLIDDSSTVSTAQYVRLVGFLSFGIALLYAGLWGMRTGLLTRFTGSFATALGVVCAIPFFTQVGAFGTVLWMVYISFFLGRRLERRPPAWSTGQAIPWPKPGEQPPAPPGEPGTLDGSGREVLERPLPEGGDEADAADDETQGQRRKKRKRR